MVAPVITPEHIQALKAKGRWDLLRKYHATLTPLNRFRPRPDSPEEFDEQTSFMESAAKFSVIVGGNGSGKTLCAAVKTARYVLDTPPFRDNCPFWIIGETFELTCATCWDEKLAALIPKNRIRGYHWHNPGRNWPRAVMLKHPDDPNRTGWVLEFKSYDQGAALMQGRSIGGYWFNEECPLEIVEEVQVRCRDYDSPGWADFTPIHIRDARWADIYDEPRPGWQFFRMNVLKNKTKKVQQWAETYLPGLNEDERETRTTGAFAGFSGQVFKEFVKKIHVISSNSKGFIGDIAEQLEDHKLPTGWRAIRGLDFGWSNPLACMWIARDPDGRYYVYDEHFEAQKPIEYHAQRMAERAWKYGNPHYGPTYCDNEDPRGIDHLNRIAGVDDKRRPYFVPVNKMDRLGVQISFLRSLMMVQGDERPRFYVLSKCENLIRELRGYKWQEPIEGKRKRNPQDIPVAWDDHCLIAGTMIATERGDVPIESVTTADRVWTREGWKAVEWSGATRFDVPYCVTMSNGSTLCGTADHRVWVDGHGWKQIGDLLPGDQLLSIAESQQCLSQSTHRPSESCLAECRIGAIQTPSVASCGCTLRQLAANDCIALSGNTLSGQSSRAITSTTSTAIHSTIESRISRACQESSTCRNIPLPCGAIRHGENWLPIACASETCPAKHMPGAAPQKVAPSGAWPQSNRGLAEKITNAPAITADRSISLGTSASFGSVATRALVRVASVSAMQSPEQTFDLTVAEAHEFFAGGVLVHNCIDAMRYAIWHDSTGARSKPDSISQGYSQRESIRFSGRR